MKLLTLALGLLAMVGSVAATECSDQALTVYVEISGGTHGQLDLPLREGFAKPFKAGREPTPEAFEGLVGTARCEGRSIVIEAYPSFASTTDVSAGQRQTFSLTFGGGGAVVQQIGAVKVIFVLQAKPRPAPRRSMTA
ncbi:hypothetical protein [Xanthomonas arboricola]|uniref:Reelin domain-containing protein n=1 Tax=Xanthomonas arboricola TaxID=56448 RepID=A0AB73H4D1_9XANT|nr:hypothetical protein [Xanthomonas arboricola]MBB5672498.1 hypothetical protein [Xanthomonas arboricola]